MKSVIPQLCCFPIHQHFFFLEILFHSLFFQMLMTQSSSLLGEAKTEKYKDLRALFQLLSNLCSKDLVGLSSTCIHTIERKILLFVC